VIDTQAIRSKILDLAMRGQLTEQLPDDGTAEELYRQIQAEKQKLIKAGKIKREKPLPDIPEEEKPFPIPASWRWVYLGEVFQHNTGKALNSSDTQGQQLAYITTSNLYWNRFELDSLKTMPFTDSELEKCTVRKGDLLVCEGGDIGRSAVWPYDYDIRIQNHIHRLRRYSANICTEFYYYLLWFYKKTGRIDGIGIGLQGFSSNRVHSLIVPLAPYDEAVRVVEVIKQAFSALDTIDALQAKYADNLTVLKSKLIDAAIQGKLTEQLPEDGTADELYRQIQAEKQALIKAGKIKKEKPLPEISADEIPFEIPENWKWVRTGDIFSVGTGLTPLTTEKRFYENGCIPWVTSSLTSNRYIQDATTHLSEYALEATSLRLHPEHTLVIAMYGEGKTRGQIAELLIPATTNQACATLDNIVYNQATVDYVFFFFKHNYVQLRSQAGGSNQPNLNLNKIKETLIPLPPLAEQKRIVKRLSELLAACDELKCIKPHFKGESSYE
jgi:type I restriction enzyme S subunit